MRRTCNSILRMSGQWGARGVIAPAMLLIVSGLGIAEGKDKRQSFR